MRILCVDDKAENLYLLESMLRARGYEVALAHDGIEALQQLEQQPFDLIIADILMPRMDGFALCHEVKLRDAFRHIPLIFYTATYTEKKDKELALGLGAARFIVKPVEPEQFLAIIHDVIQEYKSGRLPSPAHPVEPETVLLNAYNRRLVRKIEQKAQQLEALSRALEATLADRDREVVERRRAEEEIRSLNKDLEQRVQQRTAELLAANEELKTFTSAVSHDLRAPLRAIEGHAQILARSSGEQLPAHARGSLDALQSEARRMDRLIQAMLQLARASRAELRPERVDLTQLALEIAADLRRENPARHVEFTATPGLRAQGDPVLLRAVLRNLLANAWKFTARSPQARIEFGQRQHDGEPAFFVRDNGAGFDMEAADKLFVPFQRLHPGSEFPGTGVGLATVQQIIRRHGGAVWAEGAVNQGATFYFTLPRSSA